MRASLAAGLVAVVATGCGSSGGGSERNASDRTLDAIWHRDGPAVAFVPGTSDYSPGEVRVSFLIVDARGRVVERPRANVWVARRRDAVPFARAVARLEPVGVPGAVSDADDVKSLYVARVRIAKPGRYWLVARPLGGRPIGALRELDVRVRSETPTVGSRAPASRTPALGSAPATKLTTRRPPDVALLGVSVADALRAHRPFVLVFATPRFCESRTCGPVVEVVDAARRRFTRSGLTFIHVEIYRDNDPAKGTNRWVRQWRLPSEPWTFLVGADGRIKAKFEGSLSLRELSSAIRSHLDEH